MQDDQAISHDGQDFVFLFEGETVPARRGQSVAAALIAAGTSALRIDEAGHFKGLLCGIGMCFECRCRINGVPDQRACMTEAEPGMRIERQQGLV
jgi:predicted molibdopterin-dependent oxidoreductase YjgC